MAQVLHGAPVHLGPGTLLTELHNAIRSGSPHSIFMKELKTKKNYTYGEVQEKVECIAEQLREKGFGINDVVMICGDSFLASTYLMQLGVWFSGATVSPINPDCTIREITNHLEISHPKAVYVDDKYLEKVRSAIEKVDWKVTVIAPNAKTPDIDYHQCTTGTKNPNFTIKQNNSKDHVISILFTSGTSGNPKGVMIRDEAMNCALQSFDWEEGSINLTVSPIFWVSNLIWFIKTIHIRGTHILPTAPTPKELAQISTEYKPNIVFTGPSTFINIMQLDDLEKYDFSSFRRAYVGGSFLSLNTKKMIIEKLFKNRKILMTGYGSTEAGILSLMPIDVDIDSPQYASIGKVVPGTSIKIVDVGSGELVGPHVPGEVCAKGNNVLHSYVQRQLSSDEMEPDGWWHMGDLGYYDTLGFIYYVSRMKEIIKYRGHQIAPAELENVVQSHPEVVECCVVGKEHESDGELPTAFVVKQPGSNLTHTDIYTFVSREVNDVKNLRGGVYFVKSIPKSAVGKPLRKELIKMF